VDGVGRGPTLLSAFYAALFACGVCNYNLIPLSSIIPPGSEVVPSERFVSAGDEHGHRLYVVEAEMRSERPGLVVAAGIGWYQWGDGRGVFVEHETSGPSRDAASGKLDDLIWHSLRDLCADRAVEFRPEQMRPRTVCAEVGEEPTSALVLAVYQAPGWW
jgi:arginine decarboxylase